ncbi:MAG: TonB-dependent receptor, partial [Gemmatimonadales bacterium]
MWFCLCGVALRSTIGPFFTTGIPIASPLLLRTPQRRTGPVRACLLILLAASAFALEPASAQSTTSGRVEGLVTRRDSGLPIAGVAVRISGTGVGSSTGADGRYSLALVPAGPHTIEFRWIGYAPETRPVVIRAGATENADVTLSPVALQLADMIVEAASKAPERIVEAPAAITVIPAYQAAALTPTNQAPAVLRNVPGFDVVQNGMHDFNINARGFNSSLNRRVLVLQDGRDLSYVLVGSQEWGALSVALDEMGKVEVVRGPGSALYGANAFNGVVNISTPRARDVLGTKFNLSVGELNTIRSDMRHARSFADGRFAYKITAGYGTSDTFSRSRTRFDSTDIVREYTPASDSVVRKARAETIPLKGQTVDPVTGAATGDRDPVRTMYGVGRLDYYAPTGALGTAEAGISQVENDIFVTTVGRVQILRSQRPYARASWATDRYYLMGYYSGRRTPDKQVSLSSGAPLLEHSGAYHVEGQFNRPVKGERGRVILGASARAMQLNTKETLLEADEDDRVDNVLSAFGQLEYDLSSKWKTVAGSRLDKGNLYTTQVSPKIAVVFTPSRSQALRATINQAFQPPTGAELFLRVPAG